MSTHKDCGENIHWFPREDEPGRFHPPMEYAGTVMVYVEGKLLETTGYKSHRCDPEKVREWQEYLATMTELKGPESFEAGISAHVAARERDREKTLEFANQVDCEVCEAEVGEDCRNMSVMKKTGEIQHTRYPHPKRLQDAERVDRMNRASS